MPHRHAAYPEESRRLDQSCREIDKAVDRLQAQETDLRQANDFNVEQLRTLEAACDSPSFMRLLLRFADGTEKDVCLGEGVRDIPLRDT